jgi:hypothetical protein
MKTIKILNREIHIKVVDLIDDDKFTLGEWKPLEETIYLKKDSPHIKETLLHEVLEVIKDLCGMKMNHQCLSTVSTILYSILKDYPDIFKDGEK